MPISLEDTSVTHYQKLPRTPLGAYVVILTVYADPVGDVGVQDGTIKYEIKLTGELSTNPLSFGEETPEYGTLVMEGVNAQHHQHMFCARLDMAVDDKEGGKGLYVSEVRTIKHVMLCLLRPPGVCSVALPVQTPVYSALQS